MNQKGFTLLEVMITMVIFGIVAASMASAFAAQAWFNTRSESRSEAVAAAQQVLDQLRFEDPASLPESGSDDPVDVTVGNHTYQVVVSYCTVPSFCTTANNRHIQVDVSYYDTVRYSVQTVFTRLQ